MEECVKMFLEGLLVIAKRTAIILGNFVKKNWMYVRIHPFVKTMETVVIAMEQFYVVVQQLGLEISVNFIWGNVNHRLVRMEEVVFQGILLFHVFVHLDLLKNNVKEVLYFICFDK
ncbi:uncharacterized protein LOC134272391 [Saccostrea cucullata]|uniref:uncharacterized protein LOC134272391 n=1 Tax=Saccostrea cuccullata TaxID=36930 RepID=UPI002ED3BE9F